MTTYESKYIDRDDYLQAKGIDLQIELQNNDNQSDKVARFIKEVTDWCCIKLTMQYGSNDLNPNLEDKWESFKPFRKMRFREGVIEQIEYILNNGAISQNSGINPNTGLVFDYSKLDLGRNAETRFWQGGFANISSGS